jgi:hypothetical protein
MMLSTKPCCTDDCQSGVVSKKELSGKSPVKENECPGCSPFFTCGSCVGFIVCKPLTIVFPVVAEKPTTYHTSYQQPYIEKITLSIWLPPKIS